MQIPDDRQFETYLKQFRPITPEPFLRPGIFTVTHRLSWVGGLIASTAAVTILAMIFTRIHTPRSGVSDARQVAPIAWPTPTEPLSARAANACLSAAPSFKDALNGLAFRSQTKELESGKQSAVTVLSKERIKL